MNQQVTYDRIMQTAMGFWASKTLMSAVELGIFDALAGRSLDAKGLRLRVGVHERSALDFFDDWSPSAFCNETSGASTPIVLRPRAFSTAQVPTTLAASSRCSTRAFTGSGAP